MLNFKSLGNSGNNLYKKVFILDIKSRFICGESSLCVNFVKFINIMKKIGDLQKYCCCILEIKQHQYTTIYQIYIYIYIYKYI